jgi:hypothetical protein
MLAHRLQDHAGLGQRDLDADGRVPVVPTTVTVRPSTWAVPERKWSSR